MREEAPGGLLLASAAMMGGGHEPNVSINTSHTLSRTLLQTAPMKLSMLYKLMVGATLVLAIADLAMASGSSSDSTTPCPVTSKPDTSSSGSSSTTPCPVTSKPDTSASDDLDVTVSSLEVSICRDATYTLPSSRGALCIGAGSSPTGISWATWRLLIATTTWYPTRTASVRRMRTLYAR